MNQQTLSEKAKAIESLPDPAGKNTGLLKGLSDFAQILVSLSEETNKQHQENLKVQQKVVELTETLKTFTKVLIFIGIVQAFAALYPVFQGLFKSDQTSVSTNQIVNSNQPAARVN